MTTDREALRALAEAALSPRDGDYEYERLDTREGHALAAARDHPIQRGICDEHRRPFWKAEADNDAEVRRTEGVLKGIAREALRARGAGR